MEKTEIKVLCKRLLNGVNYEILDGAMPTPKHIRIAGMCDVWPQTGTIKVNGSKYFIKGELGLKKLAELLGDPIKQIKDSQSERITTLERQVKKLLADNEYLSECVEELLFLVKP